MIETQPPPYGSNETCCEGAIRETQKEATLPNSCRRRLDYSNENLIRKFGYLTASLGKEVPGTETTKLIPEITSQVKFEKCTQVSAQLDTKGIQGLVLPNKQF